MVGSSPQNQCSVSDGYIHFVARIRLVWRWAIRQRLDPVLLHADYSGKLVRGCFPWRPFFSWWRHQMDTFPHYWPFVWAIHWSPVISPHKGRWCGALKFYLICACTNNWVNTRDAGDLRRRRAHYGVTVMFSYLQANFRYRRMVSWRMPGRRLIFFTCKEAQWSCYNFIDFCTSGLGVDAIHWLPNLCFVCQCRG